MDLQLKAYKEASGLLLQDLSSRVRQLETNNTELKHSLEYTQGEVDDLKKENKSLKEELVRMKPEVLKTTEIDNKLQIIKERMDYQEDYSRRKNLRFSGIQESQNETWEESQEKIQRLLRDNLNMGEVGLERAHRVGPRNRQDESRPRTIVARFKNFNDRQGALRSCETLISSSMKICVSRLHKSGKRNYQQ